MASRRFIAFLVAVAVTSMGATFRTPNFVVEAANDHVAQQVGQYAEKYRKEKALEWLGKEMPNWGQPCPLKVTVTPGQQGAGYTTFAFDHGAILSQEMNVSGPLERILNSVLPHEITHTVFAYQFRQPLPRWADEGGSVLSEDDLERRRHDELVRQILAGGRAFRLGVLLDISNHVKLDRSGYPSDGRDVATLYAQGYSLSRFLVESSSKPAFLSFVAHGMRHGWDSAVQTHYRWRDVNEMEAKWLDWMRGVYRPDPDLLARSNRPGETPVPARPAAQLKPPQGASVIRAAGPDEEAPRPVRMPAPPPGIAPARDGWSPVPLGSPVSPPAMGVRLLPPQR